MTWLDGYRMRLLLVGFVAAIVIGSSGRANADFMFGTPQNLGPPVNDSYGVRGMCISRDGLSLYFSSDRCVGYGGYDLWVATRETTDDNWGDPVNLGQPANTAYDAWDPSISSDGLSLYFGDGFDGPYMPGGYGWLDLWVATRNATSEPFGAPINLGPTLNNAGPNEWPCISADGLSLYCSGWHPSTLGLCDLWVSTRTSTNEDWQAPVNLQTVNSPYPDGAPDISADGLALFFISTRPRGFTSIDDFELWMTTRRRTSEPFGEPVKLPPHVNTEPYSALFPNLSSDGSTLYFCSNRPGGFGGSDVWQVPIIPIVDFNVDGIVDATDVCIMVDRWHTDNSLCDIGPAPWGDGIVDVQDLIVLAEHLFEEILPPDLVAYWRLDEVESNVAHDSVGDNHGTVYSEPLWQPDSGKVAGALQFDGIDDYIATDFVLDPSLGAFSVFAWIKGGAPGNVLISQVDGIGGNVETWLGNEPVSGKLMTGLVPPPLGRFIPKPLVSESVITDGQWHHIGFVWDGAYRSLYVDGVEVAKDTAAINPLKSAIGGLYFGVSSTLEAGTFFSGLIDDVRIFDVALTAEKIAALAQ
jgi:hypothetical protein